MIWVICELEVLCFFIEEIIDAFVVDFKVRYPDLKPFWLLLYAFKYISY